MTWKPCTRCGGTGREVDWAAMGARTPEEVIARAIVAALPIEDLVAFVQDPEVRHVISLWVDDLIDPAPLHMGGPPPVFRDGSPVVVDPDGWRRDNRP